jgi:hypothetical protein
MLRFHEVAAAHPLTYLTEKQDKAITNVPICRWLNVI